MDFNIVPEKVFISFYQLLENINSKLESFQIYPLLLLIFLISIELCPLKKEQ